MSREIFEAAQPDMVTYDLQNYGEAMLSESGELELMPYFRHDVYLSLGKNALIEVSRISIPAEDKGSDVSAKDKNFYVVRNSVRPGAEPVIISDDPTRVKGIDKIPGLGAVTAYGSTSLVIGRAATPELQLPSSVSKEHMRIRTGGLQQRVHFRDENSTNGTKVYLHKDDTDAVLPPRRRRYLVDGKLRHATEIEGEWKR